MITSWWFTCPATIFAFWRSTENVHTWNDPSDLPGLGTCPLMFLRIYMLYFVLLAMCTKRTWSSVINDFILWRLVVYSQLIILDGKLTKKRLIICRQWKAGTCRWLSFTIKIMKVQSAPFLSTISSLLRGALYLLFSCYYHSLRYAQSFCKDTRGYAGRVGKSLTKG
jgi:hypothetical protein